MMHKGTLSKAKAVPTFHLHYDRQYRNWNYWFGFNFNHGDGGHNTDTDQWHVSSNNKQKQNRVTLLSDKPFLDCCKQASIRGHLGGRLVERIGCLGPHWFSTRLPPQCVVDSKFPLSELSSPFIALVVYSSINSLIFFFSRVDAITYYIRAHATVATAQLPTRGLKQRLHCAIRL